LTEGRPIAYDTTLLPLRVGELLSGMDLTQETIYHVLKTRYAIPVLSGAFYISATEATAQQAAYLEVAPGSALLVIQRISYTTGDESVYIQERYYRQDRLQYRVILRRHNDEGGGSKIDEIRAVFAVHAPEVRDLSHILQKGTLIGLYFSNQSILKLQERLQYYSPCQSPGMKEVVRHMLL
jgi:hypothetical protein